MRLKKQLNIDNTNRSINFNQSSLLNVPLIKVSKSHRNEVLEALNDNNGQGYYFLIKHGQDEDLRLNFLVYRSKGYIYYYTKDVIPISAMLNMGTNPKLYLVYEYTGEFTKQQLINIKTAFELTTVYIYIPYIDVSYDPRKYLFDLFDVRFIADAVLYDFRAAPFNNSKNYVIVDNHKVAKPEIQKDFFDVSHEILARWKLQLTILSTSKKEEVLIRNLAIGR